MEPYLSRLAALRAQMATRGLDAALLAPTDHMRYLVGWAESGHERLLALVVTADAARIVAPALNAADASSNARSMSSVIPWTDADGWAAAMAQALGDGADGCVGIDDELHAGHLLRMQELFPQARFRSASGAMSALRTVKGADELDLLERSAEITDDVCDLALRSLREGMTELELQEVIAAAYRERSVSMTFCIVGFGPNSAMPHHATDQTRLRRGDVVIVDIGCGLQGYQSDITRTVAFGRPDPEAVEVYRIVRRAHEAVYGACRPGAAACDLDRAARRVIEEAGYGPRFFHRLGHGIGLSGHEHPYITEGNSEPLAAGNCFSNEPGVYLDGRFGVRIENCMVVTEQGGRSLNRNAPPALPIL
jgi:Xaa-Pro aminopeptidase